jgi:hypothetical protein
VGSDHRAKRFLVVACEVSKSWIGYGMAIYRSLSDYW